MTRKKYRAVITFETDTVIDIHVLYAYLKPMGYRGKTETHIELEEITTETDNHDNNHTVNVGRPYSSSNTG